MAISMALGGFSVAEADELRRAMGHHKKLPKLHAALQRLETRMTQNGVAPGTADHIVEDLYSFANYGFPESHAWSFALIAYATAYLKAHYPAEFFLGLLDAWPMGFYPPATLVHQARRDGVTVLAPCLRDGAWDCDLVLDAAAPVDGSEEHGSSRPDSDGRTGGRGERGTAAGASRDLERGGRSGGSTAAPGARVEPTARPTRAANVNEPDRTLLRHGGPPPALRVGWKHIRGLGDRARDALQAAREDGPFTSVQDVVRRAQLSRPEALHLARAGAFEAFEPGRRRAAWEALRAAGDTLPLAPARRLPFDPDELEGQELIFLDYLATGISTHGHPMEHLRPRLDDAGVTHSAGLADLRDREPVVIAGLVVARQHPATANDVVFLLLEDEHGFLNAVIMPDTYKRNRETINNSPFLLIEGRLEHDGPARNVLARRFRRLRSTPIAARSHDYY